MTLQRRDIINYQENKYALNCDILKPYFEANPNRKPEKIGFDSNLHRGYFSEFEIIDNQLLIVDLRVNIGFEKDSGAYISKSVIESALLNDRLCTWFNGSLLLFSLNPKTDRGRNYLSLKIKEGIVVEIKSLSEKEYDDLGNHAYDYF